MVNIDKDSSWVDNFVLGEWFEWWNLHEASSDMTMTLKMTKRTLEVEDKEASYVV